MSEDTISISERQRIILIGLLQRELERSMAKRESTKLIGSRETASMHDRHVKELKELLRNLL